jgi:hypothetical protein
MLTEYGKVLKKLRIDENETRGVMHAYHLSIVRFFTFAEAEKLTPHKTVTIELESLPAETLYRDTEILKLIQENGANRGHI